MVRAQFLRFALVGVAATATTYLVLITGVELLGVDAVAASIAGYLAGIVVNYLLNYRFTFRSQQRHRVVLPRYLAVMLVGLLLNAGLMYVGVNWLGIHYALAQFGAIAVVLVWSFAANRVWAFTD